MRIDARLFAFVIMFSFVVLLASGCTPQQGYTPPRQQPPAPVVNETIKEIRMAVYHSGYDPSLITVNKGDKVRILAVTGPGTAAHNHGISIDAYGINSPVTSETTPVLVEFVADKPGRFTIYCGSCKTGIYGNAHPDIRGTLEVK